MSRRVYAAWRSATTFFQGCPAEMSSWGLAHAFISRPERSALKRGQRGFVLRALKDSAEVADSKKRDDGRFYDKDTDSVTLFIESYFAANQKYPTIALVVRETGGVRNTVKKMLDDFKSGRNALASQESYMEGSGNTDSSNTMCAANDSMSSNNGNKDLTLHAVASEEVYMESSADMESRDAMCLASSSMPTDILNMDVDEFEQLAPMVRTDAAEAMLDGTDTEDFAEVFRENGNPYASDLEFLELLDQANSKENAINKTAPLIKALQQTASGSRRVHLSAWRGAEKDLSWDNTLVSIMPSSIDNKQPVNSDDRTSCPLSSTGKEVGKDSSSTFGLSSSTLSTPTETGKDSHGTCEPLYAVKLMSTKRQTVLNQFSSANLVEELKRNSEVFLDLRDKVVRVHRKTVSIHAIVYFKTKKGKMDALDLKSLVIRDETLLLEDVTSVAVDEKSPEELGALNEMADSPSTRPSVLSERLQVSRDLSVEGESLSGSAIESSACNQENLLSSSSFLENTISIENCPSLIPLDRIRDFFSGFGAVRVMHGKYSPDFNGSILINFENKRDKQMALNIHQFVVDRFSFCIRTGYSSKNLMIRLLCAQEKRNQNQAMEACKKYGAVSHFKYTKKGGVLVAYYKSSQKERASDILASLRQDKDLKGIWKPTLVFEGYRLSAPMTIMAGNIDLKKLVDLSRQVSDSAEQLSILVQKLNPVRHETLNSTVEV